MKIGFINFFSTYPIKSGGSVHAHQITHGLLRKGHEIYAMDHEKESDFKLYPYTSEGIKQLSKNVDILYIRIGSEIVKRMQPIIDSLSIPIVWEINAPETEGYAWFRRIKSRSGFHIKARFSGWKNEYQRKKMAKQVNAAICVSEELKRYAQKFLKIKNVFVVPNGSDLNLFNPNAARDNLFKTNNNYFKVLWSGNTYWPWHRFDIAYKVAQRFLDINPELSFIFLMNRNNKLPEMPRNSVVVNEVAYESVPAYFASVDACLLLYETKPWTKWGFYGSSIKLFDYMACAKPVIASNVGQIGRVIRNGENGLLTNNDVNDIVEKVLFLIKNRNKVKRIGQCAREDVVNYYNWERALQQTETVLTNCLR